MMWENSTRRGNVYLRIDCSRLRAEDIAVLAELIARFLAVQVVGGDLIFASGTIGGYDYDNVWKILDRYDVIID